MQRTTFLAYMNAIILFIALLASPAGAVLPEIVTYEENGIDAIGMDYSKMTPLLVEALNALRAEKDAEIDALHEKNAALEQRLARLETAILGSSGE